MFELGHFGRLFASSFASANPSAFLWQALAVHQVDDCFLGGRLCLWISTCLSNQNMRGTFRNSLDRIKSPLLTYSTSCYLKLLQMSYFSKRSVIQPQAQASDSGTGFIHPAQSPWGEKSKHYILEARMLSSVLVFVLYLNICHWFYTWSCIPSPPRTTDPTQFLYLSVTVTTICVQFSRRIPGPQLTFALHSTFLLLWC